MAMDRGKELDSISLEMFNLMDEYITLQKGLENRVNGGYLHLSKARYIMGENNVTSLQIPQSDIAASTLVQRKEIAGEQIFQVGEETQDTSGVENVGIEPIKWFGVLTPQSLKLAQNSFTKGLGFVGDLATVSAKIQALTKLYAELSQG